MSNPDWSSFYAELKGRSGIHWITLVDANDAGNLVTWPSHSNALLFLQNSPIVWLRQGQRSAVKTPTTSIFGSRLGVFRAAHDMTIVMRFKLRMSGVPLPDGSGPSAAEAAGALYVKMDDTHLNLEFLFTKVLPVDRRRELSGSNYLWQSRTPKVSDHSMV